MFKYIFYIYLYVNAIDCISYKEYIILLFFLDKIQINILLALSIACVIMRVNRHKIYLIIDKLFPYFVSLLS